MSITKKIFTTQDDTIIQYLKQCIENANIFDSVSYEPNDGGARIHCYKNDIQILYLTSQVITMYNNNSTQLFSESTSGNMVACSVIQCGNAVIVTTICSNPGGSHRDFSYCIDVSENDSVTVSCVSGQFPTATPSFNVASENSLASGTSYNLNAPLSTSENYVSLYKVVSTSDTGNVNVCNNTYGIRVSPAMHTLNVSTAGATLPTVIINGTSYVTNGFFCVSDC